IVEETWPTARLSETATPARSIPKISVVTVVRIGSVSARPTPASAALTATHTAPGTATRSAKPPASTAKPMMTADARVAKRSERMPANGAATRSATLMSDATAPDDAIVKPKAFLRYVGIHAVTPYALKSASETHADRYTNGRRVTIRPSC